MTIGLSHPFLRWRSAKVWLVLSFLSIALLACQPPEAPIEPTRPVQIATPQALIKATRPVDTATAIIALLVTPEPARELPTNTPTTTLPTYSSESTNIGTLVASRPLTIRQPTVDELRNYLDETTISIFFEDEGTTPFTLENFFDIYDLTENAEMIYEDLNGDDELDLIFADFTPSWWGRSFITVFLWQTDHYLEPLLIIGGGKYSQNHHILVADWTEDDVPEIIFDFHNSNGGTGYVENTWHRYVIHCREICDVVWSGMTGQVRSSYPFIGITQTNIERALDEKGSLNISVNTEVFDFLGYLEVHESSLEVYTWNGHSFEQTYFETLSQPYKITSQSALTATNIFADVATIDTVFRDPNAPNLIYACSLYVNGVQYGESVECHKEFTTVEWMDVTDDGRSEIVFKVLNHTSQSFFIFQWDGTVATQIAHISGDIMRPDLYGVRLEDVDGDTYPEIVAGNLYSEKVDCKSFEIAYSDKPYEECWQELSFDDLIYKWDGANFVLWEGGS